MSPRFSLVTAVYLLLQQENKVLLLLRKNTSYMDGWYSLPAGHHDGGQTLTEAMCREAKEEIGVTVRPEDLQLAHVMHRQANDGERVDFYFSCATWEGEIANMEPEKCGELRWVSQDDLPENVIPVVRQALTLARNNRIYSEAME